ncbi:hypothetical protein BH23PLA1_BH23PLA1_13070 [soil metagenome]
MKVALDSLLRLIIVAGAILTLVAIGLGHNHHSNEVREPGRSDYICLSGFLWSENANSPRILDPRDQAMHLLPLAEGDWLDLASVSPWVNQEGEAQIVGRWMQRSGRDSDIVSQEFGLARYSYPSGRLIDQVPSTMLPVTPVCWYPGTEARVLFVAGDGQLYQHQFEPRSADDLVVGARQPLPIRWGIDPPGDGPVIIHDVSWPAAPELGQRLLASISIKRRSGDRWAYSESAIWWLRLGADGSTIEAAGPLHPDDPQEPAIEARRPALGRSPEGQPLLAFISRDEESKMRTLRLISLEIDPESGDPRIVPGSGRLLAEDCALVAPVFSKEGTGLSYFFQRPEKTTEIRHLRLDASRSSTFAWASFPANP